MTSPTVGMPPLPRPAFRVEVLLTVPALALILALILDDYRVSLFVWDGGHPVSLKGVGGIAVLAGYGCWLVRELRRTMAPARLRDGVGLWLRGAFLLVAGVGNFAHYFWGVERSFSGGRPLDLVGAFVGFGVLCVAWVRLALAVEQFGQFGQTKRGQVS